MTKKIILQITEEYFEQKYPEWISIDPEKKDRLRIKEIESIRDQVKNENKDTIVINDNINVFVLISNENLKIEYDTTI